MDLFKHTHTIAQRPRNRIHAHAHTGSAQPSAAKGDQHTGLNAHTAAVSVCDRESAPQRVLSLSRSLYEACCVLSRPHTLYFSRSLSHTRSCEVGLSFRHILAATRILSSSDVRFERFGSGVDVCFFFLYWVLFTHFDALFYYTIKPFSLYTHTHARLK